MSDTPPARSFGRIVTPLRLLLGFAAGFLAVLIFHQGMVALLGVVDLTQLRPYPMDATRPFGVPQVWSAALWGGVWGILFSVIDIRFPRGPEYWGLALLFGALALTLVSLFVVMPLEGRPVAAGGDAATILTGVLVNAAWGLGTGILLRSSDRAVETLITA